MKTVLIHGQNHEGSSCHMGRMLADKIASPGEQREFFLPRDLNHFCSGCFRCVQNEENCPYYEDKKKIMDAVAEAEVLIFTTPTYCMHASAPMKSFLDLTFTNWMNHRPKEYMFSKKAVILSSAAGMGTGSAIKDIKTALTYWGIPKIYSFGLAVQAMNWEQVPGEKKSVIEKNTDRIAKKLLKKKKPSVGIKTRALFFMMMKMQAAGWGASPEEKEYWEKKGWLEKARPWKNTEQCSSVGCSADNN